MSKEFCKHGANVSYPIGTIVRTERGSITCINCPLNNTCLNEQEVIDMLQRISDKCKDTLDKINNIERDFHR